MPSQSEEGKKNKSAYEDSKNRRNKNEKQSGGGARSKSEEGKTNWNAYGNRKNGRNKNENSGKKRRGRGAPSENSEDGKRRGKRKKRCSTELRKTS